jgi:hypothetical protein
VQSYTNASAVISVKNQSSLTFDYTVIVEHKIGGKWPNGLALGTMLEPNQTGTLSPGQQRNLTVPVMVYAPPYPWRISVFCWENLPLPNATSFRVKCILWLIRLHMPKLAQKLAIKQERFQVSSPQMEQYEK